MGAPHASRCGGERAACTIHRVSAVEGCGAVSASRTAWTDGHLSGYVYDFVTWHTDGHCGTLCPGEKNYKRLTVVVTVTVPGATHPVTPVRVSVFIADPNASVSK